MNETLTLVLALGSGILLGGIFFGGLWWTVKKVVLAARPALWLIGSMFLRTGIVLGGFFVFARDSWESVLMCLLGFIIARIIVTRLTLASGTPAFSGQEASHAP
ncbi:MAG: ATP synthase subunit I [Acidobacteriota bacterium]